MFEPEFESPVTKAVPLRYRLAYFVPLSPIEYVPDVLGVILRVVRVLPTESVLLMDAAPPTVKVVTDKDVTLKLVVSRLEVYT